MGLLLGALAGAGKGFSEVADTHIAQWNEDKKRALMQEAEIAKEKRIEEAQGRERKATLDFNTDPANVARSTQAKVSGQSGIDQYKDSRFQTDLDQKTQEYNATHPYEKEKTLAEIDAQKANSDYYRSAAAQKYDTSGISNKEDRKQYETLLKVLDRKKKNLDALDEKESLKPGSGYASPAERMSMLKEIHDLGNAINGAESELTGSNEGNALSVSARQDGDAFGISQQLSPKASANKEIPKITDEHQEVKAPGLLSRVSSSLSELTDRPDKIEEAKMNAERRGRINESVSSAAKAVVGVLNPKQQAWFDGLSKSDQERFNNLPRRDKIAALNAVGL